MVDYHSSDSDFLTKITTIVEENISDTHFGVSELAREAGMSRSNLLRKVKKLTKLSASQFIRQVRLKSAMDILKQSSSTVSEVSYEVGFGSTSYFIKCFHDYYGYPPGEVGKRELPPSNDNDGYKKRQRITILLSGVILIILLVSVSIAIIKPFSKENREVEKSIAVLPFKNDSNDSSNIYLINGLMESVLDNLQKIEDLRIISRTSVEKYRNSNKSIPEIARELNVSYFVEGSGQKIGDQIMLSIQLIEGENDKHLWSEQYNKEVKDIFSLQQEIARKIANEIEAVITPEEKERIDKIPTDNLVAYDYFLKGLNLVYRGDKEGLIEAISFFEKALEEDNEFARAYADISISYSLLDMYQVTKQYSEKINTYADKALLFDDKLAQSLVAKALYYINIENYEQAVPYLERALEHNPNSAMVINTLSDFYANYIPDTEKYLEYALKGIRLDIAANDSISASYIFLHLSNAFIQSGFTTEAEEYINKSLDYNRHNSYAELVNAYIQFAKTGNLQQTKELLVEILVKDSTRYDILQEIGKICYYMRDYDEAYSYYRRFMDIREALDLDVYRFENAKIGVVLSELGLEKESDTLFLDYLNAGKEDRSIYKNLSLAMYYSYNGDPKKAIEHLTLFSELDNYHYWTLLFLEIDPLTDPLKEIPEYNRILSKMKLKFWSNYKKIKDSLEEKGLI